MSKRIPLIEQTKNEWHCGLHDQRVLTKIVVNLGDPDLAFQTSLLPADRVGLARMVLIISEAIKIYPMALPQPDRVEDQEVRAEIERLAARQETPNDDVVETLSEGVGTIAI